MGVRMYYKNAPEREQTRYNFSDPIKVFVSFGDQPCQGYDLSKFVGVVDRSCSCMVSELGRHP